MTLEEEDEEELDQGGGSGVCPRRFCDKTGNETRAGRVDAHKRRMGRPNAAHDNIIRAHDLDG